jgi:hypothetical protein
LVFDAHDNQLVVGEEHVKVDAVVGATAVKARRPSQQREKKKKDDKGA